MIFRFIRRRIRTFLKGGTLFAAAALFAAPAAYAATVFAVLSTDPAIDGGTLLVSEYSTTSVDVYLANDPTETNSWGYSINLYQNGSTFSNILLGSESTGGSWQQQPPDPDYYLALGCTGGNCGGLLTLVATLDVTVGTAGTSADADGYAQGAVFPSGGDLVNYTVLVEAVPEPSEAVLLIAALAAIAAIRISRGGTSQPKPRRP